MLLDDGSASTETDDDGRYELPHVSSGKHVLHVSKPGLHFEPVTAAVHPRCVMNKGARAEAAEGKHGETAKDAGLRYVFLLHSNFFLSPPPPTQQSAVS